MGVWVRQSECVKRYVRLMQGQVLSRMSLWVSVSRWVSAGWVCQSESLSECGKVSVSNSGVWVSVKKKVSVSVSKWVCVCTHSQADRIANTSPPPPHTHTHMEDLEQNSASELSECLGESASKWVCQSDNTCTHRDRHAPASTTPPLWI